jgi:hypothetical protein
MQMDFLAEYDELCNIPTKIGITYTLLSMFKVQLKDSDELKRGLHWPGAIDSKLSDEFLIAFKGFLKAKRAELKKCDVKTNCGRIMWFIYSKLLEADAFDVETRRDIIAYMDICEYIIL